jgi:TPR repeat protein
MKKLNIIISVLIALPLMILADNVDTLVKLHSQGFENQKNGNHKEALRLYNKACNGGYIDACAFIGDMYIINKNIQNIPKGIAILDKACEDDSTYACRTLGYTYYYGNKVKQDKAKSINYFSKACKLNDKNSCNTIQKVKNNTLKIPKK